MKKLNSLLLITFLVFISYSQVKSQSLNENKGVSYFGIGGGIGYVNPKEINITIKNHYETEADIVLAFNVELILGYFFTNQIEIKGALIAAAAFSQVKSTDMIGMSNNKTNMLTRISPAIIGNYHISRSFYAGGGFSYNKLALYIDSDDVPATGKPLGYIVNIGLLPPKGRNQTYLELVANIINDEQDYMNFSGINLQFGIRF